MPPSSTMTAVRREVRNSWDLKAFNWKLGLISLAFLTAIALLVSKLGNEGLALAMGILMSLLVLATSPKESRGWALTRFSILGAVATYLGVAISGANLTMAIALGVVCFLASFGAGINPALAGVASMISIWMLMALTLLGDGISPGTRALYFLLGALIVAIPVIIGDRRKGVQRGPFFPTIDSISRRMHFGTDDFGYAVLFAAVGVITLIAGVFLTPDHPQWTASTALILMPAVGGGSIVKTVQRVVGTALGAFLVVAVMTVVDDRTMLIGIAVVSGFLVAATIKVNSTLFAVFLTSMIVAATGLSGVDIHSIGRERVIGTLVGAAVAVIGILAARYLLPAEESVAETANPA